MALESLTLNPFYSSDNCPDLLQDLYVPLLSRAIRYDRTTYTFNAKGLIAAAIGAAAFIRNGGKIRLLCDHAVDQRVLEAIRRGEQSAEKVLQESASRQDLTQLEADDLKSQNHLELACWLVANNILRIKVCLRSNAIFHAKHGIVEDSHGHRVAFSGSLNETRPGWEHNWESVHVFTDRDPVSKAHLEGVETQFQRLWSNEATGLQVIDLPDYFRDYIVEHAPPKPPEGETVRETKQSQEAISYWRKIHQALVNDPDSTVSTIPASLWPHQERFRQENVESIPIRRLIADEVGLGKTLQAGILLKTRLNQGKARKILVIAPKAAVRQWQSELLMKFAIDIPLISTLGLTYRDGRLEEVSGEPWHAAIAIASHQWLVRNRVEFLNSIGDYDFIICDEAHRARFDSVDNPSRRRPNQYLSLMRELSRRTKDLLLLTATPMQLNEVELWALLELLEPTGWQAPDYQQFHRRMSPNLREWKARRELWRRTNPESVFDAVLNSNNDDYIVSEISDPDTLNRTIQIMEQSSPARRIMSRNTRNLLRHYQSRGLLDAKVPIRKAEDEVVNMTEEERHLYDGIADLVKECYTGPEILPQGLGLIMTVFRKRLSSSSYAYARTLRNAANRINSHDQEWTILAEDADLDEDKAEKALHRFRNVDFLIDTAKRAEAISETDTKRNQLPKVINRLQGMGHQHILMFTQFRDTQTWLADFLRKNGHNVTELHGQDKELGDRTERLMKFRQQESGILLCTETASESLNLQFCTSVINYDIPWNPMTLEQRAGRVDRIGQERPVVNVVNLFYAGTAEHDAYHAVARRFAEIKSNVGEYPPIIAATITRVIREDSNAEIELERITKKIEVDIDKLILEWDSPIAPLNPQITMDDLERPLREPSLMPPGWHVEHQGGKHWDVTPPNGNKRRVTTKAEAYEKGDGRLEWWTGPVLEWP